MQESLKRFIFIICLLILAVLPVISQETTPTIDASLIASNTPTPTASITPSPTSAEITPELTLELSLSPSPSPTATEAETTPELTEIPGDATFEPTATATAFMTTPEVTEVVEATELIEVTEVVEITAEVTEPASAITATATPGGYVPQILRGEVRYQNRAEQSAIHVSVYSLDGILLSVGETNARGVFSLAAPSESAFILVIEAPLHRSVTLLLEPDELLPALVLAGGDLDNDGCINKEDMQVLLDNYEQANTAESDINSDGLTDLSDLAILTGNFDANCGLSAEATEAALP